MMLDLEKIEYDPKYYPRVNGQADWMTELRYTEALLIDPRFEMPPVVVVRATGYKTPFILIDGLHRKGAYHRADRSQIPAKVERIPKSKWLARSVELNSQHGRPLDTGDKSWIATRLHEEEGWTRPEIADLLHMRVESLEKMMVTHCTKISSKAADIIAEGRSNREIKGDHYGFLKSAVAKTNGTRASIAALQTQHSITSHDALAVLNSMISILEAGVVDMTNEEIAARILAIRKLLKSL